MPVHSPLAVAGAAVAAVPRADAASLRVAAPAPALRTCCRGPWPSAGTSAFGEQHFGMLPEGGGGGVPPHHHFSPRLTVRRTEPGSEQACSPKKSPGAASDTRETGDGPGRAR